MSDTVTHKARAGFLGAFRGWPAAAFPFCAATAIFSTVTLASVPQAWLQGAGEGAPAPAAATATARAADEPAGSIDGDARGRGGARCTSCGIVESVSRVDAGPGAAASYEFKVRMRDGSTRVSRMDSAADWRSGDRIMLIGGANATRD